VVDTGPEPGPVDGCLTVLGISSVPLLVISHFHEDHNGGVAGVFRHRVVGSVWLPAYAEPVAGRDAVLAAALGVPVTTVSPGTAVSLGQVTVTVAGPVVTLHGTRSDPNNNSVVLLAAVGNVRLLLTGDAEVEEQQELAASGGPGRIDVLKVAHHGSSFQDMGFLDSLRPRIAVVSVGAGNVYGHPNASVLAHLSRGGARVVRTDQQGAIAIGVDQGSLFVTAQGRSPVH
jgi:competence protein ComEC